MSIAQWFKRIFSKPVTLSSDDQLDFRVELQAPQQISVAEAERMALADIPGESGDRPANDAETT